MPLQIAACMAGVGLKHLTGDVKKMMSKVLAIDQNNYPEMLGRTVIINAPSIFKMLFGAIKPMLDARTQGKIEVRRQCFPSLKVFCAPSLCLAPFKHLYHSLIWMAGLCRLQARAQTASTKLCK